MGKKEKKLFKNSLQFFDETIESSGRTLVYQTFRYTRDSIFYCEAIAKSENLHKEDYELGLIALILFNLSQINENNTSFDIAPLLNKIIESNDLPEKDINQLHYYLDFFAKENTPKDTVEMVLLDCKDIHLGLPDCFERMALMRLQLEAANQNKFEELEWEQFCLNYYLSHNFYTKYAIEKYGILRSRNFSEIERRIEKLQLEKAKNKKTTVPEDISLSDKEGENLFKIAFRNYLNLVSLADRKAHLLIQVNSIVATVIIAFTIKRTENNANSSYYILPIVMILIVAGLTIFYAILASKPLGAFKNISEKEAFFFGSFDRIDPNFKHVSWEKYALDINQLFKGDKEMIFNELIKESFQVRKVLSKKFGFLSIAYKIFIIGQLLSIGVFLIMIIFRP